MNPRSPRLGSWLLRPFLPGGDGDPLLGDLEEEFQTVVVPERGLYAARRWHLGQCVRSVGPLLAAGVERPAPRQWFLALAAIGLQVVVPLRTIEALRTFVLGQIPLKAGLSRSPAYLAATLVAAALCLVAANWVVRRNARQARVPSWCIVGMAWLGLGLMGPRWSGLLWLGSLPCLALGAWVGGRLSGGRTENTWFEGEET